MGLILIYSLTLFCLCFIYPRYRVVFIAALIGFLIPLIVFLVDFDIYYQLFRIEGFEALAFGVYVVPIIGTLLAGGLSFLILRLHGNRKQTSLKSVAGDNRLHRS